MRISPLRLKRPRASARSQGSIALAIAILSLALPAHGQLVPRIRPSDKPRTAKPAAEPSAPAPQARVPARPRRPAVEPTTRAPSAQTPSTRAPAQAAPPQARARKIPVSSASGTGLHAQKPINFTLANGLRVVLLSDKRQPLVAVRMTYLSGTATDPNRRPGLAHLTEHLAFSPTRHIQQDLLHATLDLGASDLNGQTSNDRIEYFATVPSNRLEQLLWLESERMGFSLENFTEAYLKKEQRIVRREIALREGRGLAFLRHRNRFLYPKKHPLHDVAEQKPERASLSDVQAFFQGTHRPDNAVLAIVGDIQVAHAKRLVEKYFAPIVNPPVPRLSVEIPDVERPRKEERQLIFHGWARTEVGLDFVLPRVRDLKRLSCYLLIMLHWRDELEKGLVESNYLASGLGTGLSWGFRPTLLGSTIYSPLNVRPDVVAKKSIAITHSALSEVQKILGRRRALKLQISSGFQELQDKSVSFTEEVVVYGRAFSLGERLRIVDSITADDINRVLSEDFGRTSLRTSLFAPGGESAEGKLYR